MKSNRASWLTMIVLAVIGLPGSVIAQDLRGTPNGKYNNHPTFNSFSSGSHSHHSHGWNGGGNWNRGWSGGGWNGGWNNGWGGWGGSGFWPGNGGVYNFYGGFFPAYGGITPGYGWSPNYYQSTVYASNYWQPYGVYYNPSAQYTEYFLPPHEPAELRWGPQAIKQFYGLPRDFAMGPLLSQNLTDLPNPTYPTLTPDMLRVALGERKEPGIPEPSQPAARERASRYVAFGDRLFKEQRFHEAMAKYRDAVAAAPDLAAPQFRLGLGYLATGRMEEGAESFQRGMQLDPQYIFTTSFNLEELYAGNPLAKNALLEGIARRTINDPTSSDNLFDVGIVLYLDGQVETARKYFAAARSRLSGADDSYLAPFLREQAPAAAAPGGIDL
ncbi:tetratricopeptide repeat protein [Blastopirellula sp. JC732]|uniref:Tetratricopeptide repeat protein n=1 Tax=Blastopirellula sediminis TaxID=2894196 RepID=A0A9X1SML8_9BACT|nr:tetratricopeptide repeat protein [Blastopirellula sediminis]MCC9631829.1 tetratricopeptide repeat protein [Blastopirellula sediminis]